MLMGLAAAQPVFSQEAPALIPGTFRLRVTEREISLEAQEASVAAIVADIGQHTGIPVVVYPGADERITIHLRRVPVDEALKRLAPNIVILPVQGTNAPPHRIAKIYVLAAGQVRPPQVDDGSAQPQAPVTTGAAGKANDGASRPAPFQFTFDPPQHMKPSP
jgi:hypothetical protein